jgi:general secretion pathway protein H
MAVAANVDVNETEETMASATAPRASTSASAERGFTLLEMLVVLAIVVGLVLIAATALRALRHSDLRGQAANLSRELRYAFDKSMETGACMRLTIDLDKQTYTLEATESRFFLPQGYDEQSQERAKIRSQALAAGAGINQSLASQAKAAGVDPSLFLPPTPPETQFTAFADANVKEVDLPDDVRIRDVLTSHDADKVTSGKAYIYFFPEGFVERAVLHLTDRYGLVYTLVTQPVKGDVLVQADDIDYTPGDLLPKKSGGQNGMEAPQ